MLLFARCAPINQGKYYSGIKFVAVGLYFSTIRSKSLQRLILCFSADPNTFGRRYLEQCQSLGLQMVNTLHNIYARTYYHLRESGLVSMNAKWKAGNENTNTSRYEHIVSHTLLFQSMTVKFLLTNDCVVFGTLTVDFQA